MYDVSENGDRSQCHLAILANKLDYWLLGLPFYQGYYTIHNQGEPLPDGSISLPSVGFIPNVKSSKQFLVLAAAPTQILKTNQIDYIMMYAPMTYVFVVFLFYIILLYPWSERKWTTSGLYFWMFAIGYFLAFAVLYLLVVWPLI